VQRRCQNFVLENFGTMMKRLAIGDIEYRIPNVACRIRLVIRVTGSAACRAEDVALFLFRGICSTEILRFGNVRKYVDFSCAIIYDRNLM